MSFQVHALPAALFKPLFALSDRELAGMRAARKVADRKPGVPCRVSLVDAEVGETVILLNFEHQPADSPFRSAHAIFVREGAEQAFPAVGEVPELLQSRLISIHAFDAKHCMINSDVVAGSLLAEAIPALLDDPAVTYLHLHSAKPGCYLARVTRSATTSG
jgi:hypothetical protein